jgi:broad specificity phosphatase PhoE
MLIYVRHGKTALNGEGSKERLRGWLPVPLASEGRAQAEDTGRRLVSATHGGVDSFETSDLPRAVETSNIISKHIGIQPTANTNIRDWNTGKLAGEKVEDVLPMLKYLIAHPDEPAPEGEALNVYLGRFDPAMREKVAAPGVHLVVGHARGATVLQGIADSEGGKGGEIAARFLFNRPTVQPGGILVINRDWNTQVYNPAEEG